MPQQSKVLKQEIEMPVLGLLRFRNQNRYPLWKEFRWKSIKNHQQRHIKKDAIGSMIKMSKRILYQAVKIWKPKLPLMKRLELKNLRLIDNLGLQKNSISDEFSTNRIRRNSSLWSNLKIWKRKKIKMKFFPGSHVKRVTDSIVSYLRRSLESEKLTLCLIIDSSWYR